MKRFRSFGVLLLWLLPLTRADVRMCQCDVSVPATLEARECSLCREVEKYPVNVPFVFVRDTNPNKPNRWLILPRFHGNRPQQLLEMTPEQRTEYWKAAIAKARELWGEEWGVALNSVERRTQCHMHMHIGKLLPDQENDRFVTVDGPEQMPVPPDGEGMWIHPAGGRYHAHMNEPAGELKLQK
jgi:diadenosine tetraphosphate (Ap4A) HIT family hydrolase